jgi:hypothetical protein
MTVVVFLVFQCTEHFIFDLPLTAPPFQYGHQVAVVQFDVSEVTEDNFLARGFMTRQ